MAATMAATTAAIMASRHAPAALAERTNDTIIYKNKQAKKGKKEMNNGLTYDMKIKELENTIATLESQQMELKMVLAKADEEMAVVEGGTRHYAEDAFDRGYAAGAAAVQQDGQILFAEAFTQGAATMEGELNALKQALKKQEEEKKLLENTVATLESQQMELKMVLAKADEEMAVVEGGTRHYAEDAFDRGYAAGAAAVQQDGQILFAEAFTQGAATMEGELNALKQALKKQEEEKKLLENTVATLESQQMELKMVLAKADEEMAVVEGGTRHYVEDAFDSGYAAGVAAVQQDGQILFAEAFTQGAATMEGELNALKQALKKQEEEKKLLENTVATLESALSNVGVPAEEPVGDAGTGEETSTPPSRRVRVRSAKAPVPQPTWRRVGGRLVRA